MALQATEGQAVLACLGRATGAAAAGSGSVDDAAMDRSERRRSERRKHERVRRDSWRDPTLLVACKASRDEEVGVTTIAL
jgi:hypothetical protein